MQSATVGVLVGAVVVDVGLGVVAAMHAARRATGVGRWDRWPVVVGLLAASCYGLGAPAAVVYLLVIRSSERRPRSWRVSSLTPRRALASVRTSLEGQRAAWRLARAVAAPPISTITSR